VLDRCGDASSGQLTVGGHLIHSHLHDMTFFRLIIVPGMNKMTVGVSVLDYIHLVQAKIKPYIPSIESVIQTVPEHLRLSVRTHLMENIGSFYLAEKIFNSAYAILKKCTFGQDPGIHKNIYNDSHSVFKGIFACHTVTFYCSV
jgi:hypothetical protein